MQERLSQREHEIVISAANGLTDKEIARKMNVSLPTVRTYWERLRSKIHAVNKCHAIALVLIQIMAASDGVRPLVFPDDSSARQESSYDDTDGDGDGHTHTISSRKM